MTILTSMGVEGAGASLMIDVFGDIEGFWYNFTFAVLIIVFHLFLYSDSGKYK